MRVARWAFAATIATGALTIAAIIGDLHRRYSQ